MNSRPTLIVTGADLAPQALQLLADYHIVYTGFAPPPSTLIQLCRRHDPVGIIVRYGGVNAEAMDAAPSLRVLARHGSGTDTIDLAAAQARGITVCTNVGGNATAVAEHALALLLACAKSIVPLNARIRAGHWDKAQHKSVELHCLAIGLVGLGAIGQRFARLCDALGMQVLGHAPRAKELPDYIKPVDLPTIWRESDAISLHCPLTPETRHMINAETLAACKPGVLLVNTGRGDLIDEAALLAALKRGQVAAAGLDCLSEEPPQARHPFLEMPNLVLSPHIAGTTHNTYVNMGVTAARNLLQALSMATAKHAG